MGWAVIFLALITYCTGIDGQSAWTQPPSSSVSPGETITLSCTTQNTNTIYWYQQKLGEGPRFVHCDGCSRRGEGIPDRFTATRSGTTGSLAITNVQVEDEADYYCGSWNSAGTDVFGGGTQLIVTGQPTVSPSVQAFAPSLEETTSPNPYTVVCLLTGFYPPAFELQWKGDNNQVISSGVETTKASKQGDKYVASSYLSLTKAEYDRHSELTCEVTHDKKTIAKTVSKSGSC